MDVDDRLYAFTKRDSFITIKDHKDNFENNTKCRLINPAKSDLGKISKKILTKLVTSLKERTNLNLWKNSDSVIEWFKNLDNKNSLTFIQFDICEFYPSISEKLMKDALNYAKTHTEITTEDTKTILQTKKSFLFENGTPWVKKGNKPFDVTMGSWDGAEACELVGLFLLSKLSHTNHIQVGLYRDDGLAVCALRPRQAELQKKQICRIFQEHGLKITIEANLKSVNFLDVNFNLETGIFKPYMKPNDTPLYVDVNSNHPPCILKNIPHSVNNRLSKISANEEFFLQACPPFQEALRKSGYNYQLNFNPPTQNQTKPANRKRNILRFHPPYSQNVHTNIGQKFLKLIDQNFPKEHPLSKVLNRNCIKLGYRCMPNMKKTITRHNCQALKGEEEPTQPGCNCSGENCETLALNFSRCSSIVIIFAQYSKYN